MGVLLVLLCYLEALWSVAGVAKKLDDITRSVALKSIILVRLEAVYLCSLSTQSPIAIVHVFLFVLNFRALLYPSHIQSIRAQPMFMPGRWRLLSIPS